MANIGTTTTTTTTLSTTRCLTLPLLCLLLFSTLYSSSTAIVYWDKCKSVADHPDQWIGDFYNLCILEHSFEDRIHSWKFTKAVVKDSTFKNCVFENRKLAPNNFTEAYWENVVFDSCKFGSIDIEYGPYMTFDKTVMTNVEFVNTEFDHSVITKFDRFEMNNVTFRNCSFKGNAVFTEGTIKTLKIYDSKIVHNPLTDSPGENESMYFKSVKINTLESIGNTFIHPVRFEGVNAADVSFNKSTLGDFYCHGPVNKNKEVTLRTQFNDSVFDNVDFKGPVICDEMTWRGFYGANLTFRNDADFSKSKIDRIEWDGITSVKDPRDPERKVLNFSMSYLQYKTFANISIDGLADFQQTKFEQVLVRNFYAKEPNFDSAEFINQEYIDGQCCSVACKPLKCKCNVTEPSGRCPAAGRPVNVSAPILACFPGDATVRSEKGYVISMKELALRERIAIGNGQHSDIYFFGHRNGLKTTSFIQISHSGRTSPLRLSATHYLYVNGKLSTAERVIVGDKLRDENGQDNLIVTNIDSVDGIGAYAPTTLHGDLVVDGVIVSSYTSALHPSLAHKLLHPLRLMYRAGLHSIVSRFTMFEQKSWDPVVRMLGIPRGPSIVEE